MKWKAPSERVQMMLVAPIALPWVVLLLAVIPLIIAIEWLCRRLRPSEEWHDWLAWHPVSLDDEVGFRTKDWAWLETVERRYWGGNEYRAAIRARKPQP